jgi:uncharacterized membrane protein
LDGRVEQKRSSERLVFFTDAVVAIALTLLVLPLTELVPELVAEHKPAMEAVTANWPKIFSFLLSFVVIGRFWFVHHRIFEHVRTYSTALVRANFCWLLTIVVLPFPTELIGAYATERFTALFYLGTLLASGLSHTALMLIVRRDPQVRGGAEPVPDESYWNSVASTAVFALAVVVALIRPGYGYYALLLLVFPSMIVGWALRRAGK